MKRHRISRALAVVFRMLCGIAHAAQSAVDLWATRLEPRLFPDRELLDGAGIIERKTPYRAEDAAFTPVSITAKIPHTERRYIEPHEDGQLKAERTDSKGNERAQTFAVDG